MSQADTDIFQTPVTLATGDVAVYQDGALDGNIQATVMYDKALTASQVLTVASAMAEL